MNCPYCGTGSELLLHSLCGVPFGGYQKCHVRRTCAECAGTLPDARHPAKVLRCAIPAGQKEMPEPIFSPCWWIRKRIICPASGHEGAGDRCLKPQTAFDAFCVPCGPGAGGQQRFDRYGRKADESQWTVPFSGCGMDPAMRDHCLDFVRGFVWNLLCGGVR